MLALVAIAITGLLARAVVRMNSGAHCFWSDLPRCLAGRWVASFGATSRVLHLRWLPETLLP